MTWLKNRINSEYKKHKKLDWSAIAEAKIISSLKFRIDEFFNDNMDECMEDCEDLKDALFNNETKDRNDLEVKEDE